MYKNILTPIDLGDESSWMVSVPAAVELCQLMGANLHVLTVVPDLRMSIVSQYLPENQHDDALNGAMVQLREFTNEHVPEGVNVRHIVGEGTVYDVIIKMAEKSDADLIVMGSHRPELKDYLLGPNASRVMRHAGRSVLVVRKRADVE